MPSVPINTQAALGQALKVAREEAGYTQVALAERLNIPENYLYRLESGRPNVFATRLFKVLRHLRVEVTVTYRSRHQVDR